MTVIPLTARQLTHPAILRAVQVYAREGDLTSAEETFLRAVRAADVKKTATLEQAGRDWGFGSIAWDAVKTLSSRKRDADYARALEVFEASVEAEDLLDEIQLTMAAAE